MGHEEAPPRSEDRLEQTGQLLPIVERSRALVCRNLFREDSALLRMGRFEIVRTLGRGGMGVVYEAIDPIDQGPIALKTLQAHKPSHLHRLKYEFRSLAELTHENLVTLHELFVGETEAYFTMELVDGTDFVSYARDGLPADARLTDESRLWRAFSQLCQGIRALHVENKLHRDIKPSNVLVTSSGRVVLLDFGLVHDLNDGAGRGEGTPAYMAPEQAHGSASESSDWYSVGLMLREVLYGNRALEKPRDVGSPAESELEVLARWLVQDDPAKRPSFAEISRMLAAADVVPAPPLRIPSQSVAPFTGRVEELDVLRAAFRNSRRQPVAVVVRGESGIGKSALLRQFCRTVLEPAGTLVLSGRCYERESVPYMAFDTIVDELGRHLAELPEEPVIGVGRDEAAALLHVFPVLERVGWLHARAAGSPARDRATHPVELRTRAFGALRVVLAEIAKRQPLALCIDDLQWADADSGRLLGALLCDDGAPHLLCIASDRTDPRLTNPAVDEFRSVATLYPEPIEIIELELRGLNDADAKGLARAVLGHVTTREVETELVRESRGSPLFLCELSRWRAERAEGEMLPSVDMLLSERWSNLTESARIILELIAAAGRPLSPAVIGYAAKMATEPVQEFKALRGARLIHTIRRKDGELLEIGHDRVGEAVLRSLSAGERIALHRRLAEAIEATEGSDSEALTEQFIGAQMPLEAARCARRAGDTALVSLAFSRAAWLYERALELGNWTSEEAGVLNRDHGVALEHSGRGLDAAAAYARAAALVPDALVAVQLERRAVQHLMHNGRYAEGELLLRRGYETLGLAWPSNRATLVLSIAGLSLPKSLRRRLEGSPGPVAEPLRRARVKFLSGVGQGIENYDVLRAAHNTLVCFDESEKLPDPVWRARARGTRAWLRAISASGVANSARRLSELKDACRTARSLGDVRAQADLERKLSMVHFFRGEPASALEAATRSESQMRALPLPAMDLRPIMGMIGSALMVLGRLKEARRRWDAFSHEVRLHRDLMTAAWVHGHPSRFPLFYALEERAEAESILERHASLRALHPDCITLAWTHAWCSLESAAYWRVPSDAESIAVREEPALFRSGYSVLTDAARFQRARVRVAAAEALPRGRARTALLAGAAADVKVKRGGLLGGGLSELVQAGVSMQRDRPEEALGWLRSASTELDRAGASLMAASARYVAGAMIGGDEGAALKAGARRDLDAQGVVDSLRWIGWTVTGFDAILRAKQ